MVDVSSGLVTVNDDPEEFQIRPAPDQIPALLFRSSTRAEDNQQPALSRSPSVDREADVARLDDLGATTPISDRVTKRGSFSPIPTATNSASSLLDNDVDPAIEDGRRRVIRTRISDTSGVAACQPVLVEQGSTIGGGQFAPPSGCRAVDSGG